ncbi:MAG: murein L,D-transpeptidase family protein [Paracoccaceae bacterium]
MDRVFRSLLMIAVIGVGIAGFMNRGIVWQRIWGSSADIVEVREQVRPDLSTRLEQSGFQWGAETFIRVFKEERELEVWLRTEETFELFDSYEICNHSGDLGPKLREGDHQSPEGLYEVDSAAMNPNSSYHLSFNLGFPNRYDRAHGRSGSFLMIHGDCVSVGCYAMTDDGIEDIYLIVEAAHQAGQSHVQVHAFPFEMTNERLSKERDNRWYAYWSNLKTGYDLFEANRIPSKVSVFEKRYTFQSF